LAVFFDAISGSVANVGASRVTGNIDIFQALQPKRYHPARYGRGPSGLTAGHDRSGAPDPPLALVDF